jgi:methylenetetrahydrofolate dehydrogenase (NADP+)/methenyltetrahydrofolate cyclohydrolase
MTAKIMDGKLVANEIRKSVLKRVNELKGKGIDPCLATVLVGTDDASIIYVNSKQKAAASLGISTKDFRFDSKITQHELIELITSLNNDQRIHGILIQMPLPSHIDELTVINNINPNKDVDGLTPTNGGLLLYGKDSLIPCTPFGIIRLLDFYRISVTSMNAVVINRSNLVGKPLSLLLLERDATVTICHSRTKNLNRILSEADLVVTAVGNTNKFVLSASTLREGAVVIDVGNNRRNGKVTGDVDFESVKEKASWITPVPGGVGPMTITMLLYNTAKAASSVSNLKG